MATNFPIDKAFSLISVAIAAYATPIVDLMAVQKKSPYKILAATMLSARTKDTTTAKAAAQLFTRAPDIASLSLLREEDIEKLIYPVGFYHVKARNLKKMSQKIIKEFEGIVPSERDILMTLPGVGRKTANLVVALAFNQDEICVDTHVHRIMNIWGYVTTTSPMATEMSLRGILPRESWRRVNSLLVAFGQSICLPRAPRCNDCPLNDFCPKIGIGTAPKRRITP